jgi:hypothetical protein
MDFIDYEKPTLDEGHFYKVRVNSVYKNPRIEEVYFEMIKNPEGEMIKKEDA